MKKLLLASILSLVYPAAQAQLFIPKCIPWVDTPGYVWSTPKFGMTKNGVYFRYTCWSTVAGVPDQTVIYVGLPSEIPKISSRLNTIYSSSQPLRTLQTLPNRITVEDARLPKFSYILADCDADK